MGFYMQRTVKLIIGLQVLNQITLNGLEKLAPIGS